MLSNRQNIRDITIYADLSIRDINRPLTFVCTEDNEGASIQLLAECYEERTFQRNLKYRINKEEWRPIADAYNDNGDFKMEFTDEDDDLIYVNILPENVTLQQNDTIEFKGDNDTFSSSDEDFILSFITGSDSRDKFDVIGNVMSLLQSNNFSDLDEMTAPCCFHALLSGWYGGSDSLCNIVNAENLVLPATTLAEKCYDFMFANDSNLITTPTLPATNLADYCYTGMFMYCTSLESAPNLAAETLANGCYNQMFIGCSALKNVQNALPAKTLPEFCYQSMFYECTSLKTAPELKAETLGEYCCRQMFCKCAALESVPDLSATNLAQECCKSMFEGCEALIDAPNLPAETLASNCYEGMFKGCTSLITTPEISATNLARECCLEMFMGCTALTTVRYLPANITWDDQDEQYYENMFSGCTHINEISVGFGYTTETLFRWPVGCTPNWLLDAGTESTTTPVFKWKGTAATQISERDASHVPDGWIIEPMS